MPCALTLSPLRCLFANIDKLMMLRRSLFDMRVMPAKHARGQIHMECMQQLHSNKAACISMSHQLMSMMMMMMARAHARARENGIVSPSPPAIQPCLV